MGERIASHPISVDDCLNGIRPERTVVGLPSVSRLRGKVTMKMPDPENEFILDVDEVLAQKGANATISNFNYPVPE